MFQNARTPRKADAQTARPSSPGSQALGAGDSDWLRLPILLSFALILLLVAPVQAQTETIEQIVVQGLYRMSPEAFKHALGVKEGDTYDEKRLQARFKHLWNMSLFQDITMESEVTQAGGRVLVIKVRERPVLQSVTYEDSKVVTRTDIEDRLKERGLSLNIGKPLDMGAVFFAESAIRDLVGERGFLGAEVEAEVRPVTETSRAVHYKINAGGKTRIKSIVFDGNELYSDRRLRGALEITEARKWYWPWSQKNIYHPMKWDQDVSNLQDLYRNAGHIDVRIRPPAVEVELTEKAKKKQAKRESELIAELPPLPEDDPVVIATDEPPPVPDASDLTPKQLEKQARKERKRIEKEAKKARKAKKKEQAKEKALVKLTVTVEEGPQYKLGDVSISGEEKFDEELLRRLVPIAEGQVLRNNFLEAGVDNITRTYENQGHIYATVVRRIERREGEDIADVEIIIDEDDPYTINRIEFVGNSSTHDRVLRREMLMAEGELFGRDRLDVSRMKINQLGYWRPDEPVIQPVEGENKVNINVLGQEQGRNEIQVGGGYSGFDGAFFNGVYSTRNFLGRGQVVSASMQVGGRSNRYALSFQEPWFMNRPILFGASIFRRDIDYGNTLNSESTGFGLVLGKRLGRFGQINWGYNYESVKSTTFLTGLDSDLDNVNTSVTSTFKISSLTPVYSFSTINDPYRPSRGRSINFSMQIAGGPLGGNTAFLKPVLRYTQYKRLWRNRYLAFHGQLGYVGSWAGGVELQNNNNINEVPRFQRFWLGGDQLGPRVFETRSITPRRYVEIDHAGNILNIIGDPRYIAVDDLITSGGQPALIEVGGNRFFLLQTEFVFPLNEQAEVAAFLDVGESLFDDQSFNFETVRASAGVEVRFHLPVFPVPLRLIWGTPLREITGDRTSTFTFSIGRSF